MRKIIVIIMAVALVALPTMAQTFGAPQAEKPAVIFQSTSTMTGSGSTYSASPSLNADGTASYDAAYSPASKAGRIRKSDGDDDDDWGHNQDWGEGNEGSPIGDAFWPLMLLALAYMSLRVFLKRKRA